MGDALKVAAVSSRKRVRRVDRERIDCHSRDCGTSRRRRADLGGTLLKMAERPRRTAILDLT